MTRTAENKKCFEERAEKGRTSGKLRHVGETIPNVGEAPGGGPRGPRGLPRNFTKLMDKGMYDGGKNAMSVADKRWQASQSYHTEESAFGQGVGHLGVCTGRQLIESREGLAQIWDSWAS